ncbi:MAG: bifunctional aspartate kinase/homoserine dehydrogenase I [Melioribacteraceae bacterium]|nr:bifunctional aspartate kinase/homoserine dehydrogenase I [Melioribacteraceae bacterium]
MKVLKFGGSSVGDFKRIENVIEILKEYIKNEEKISVVFSAFQGVTDTLFEIGDLALNRDETYLTKLSELEKRHFEIINNLIPVSKRKKINLKIEYCFKELRELLHGIFLIRELSKRSSDYIASFGEVLSCSIISEAMNAKRLSTEYLDARTLIKTDSSFGNAKVDFDVTYENIYSYYKTHDKTQIITGFISSDKDNVTTTMGRGGSDYTASIFGSALDVEEIEIWTDVNGILTADPRKVKNTFSIKAVTYEEAMELSHFGAKVIHPPTMIPALKKKIRIRIRNTFEPSFKGTLILERQQNVSFNIKGISSIDDITLLKISGGGMIGVAGIASRLLSALANKSISVVMISQGSSEHSICLAVLPEHGTEAKKAIENEFRYEMRDGDIREVTLQNNLSVIAVVGDDMINTTGVFGKVFHSLGQNGINIQAVAQGSSELNMSIVILKSQLEKALNTLHDSLFLSKVKTTNLFMVGPGLVGNSFLELLNERIKYLNEELNSDFKLVSLANSKKMIFDTSGIDLASWKKNLLGSKTKINPAKYIETIKELNMPNSIFIDCTASETYIPFYNDILNANISIVTPNKIANSSSYKEFKQLRTSAKYNDVHFRYSTNVGAALPIISTLNDLIANGDEVIKIEGVLSGTLSYIFNSIQEGGSFSGIVKDAREKGFTEPDPRDDLNGLDFARKLLILIRESGKEFELKNIKIENLIPAGARKAKSVDEFFENLKNSDEDFQNKLDKAEKAGKKLCYIARYENGVAKVGIEEIESDHPFYNLSGNDNIVAFTTKNYIEKPLIIRGAGAGARFTATGVFADVLRISNY